MARCFSRLMSSLFRSRTPQSGFMPKNAVDILYAYRHLSGPTPSCTQWTRSAFRWAGPQLVGCAVWSGRTCGPSEFCGHIFLRPQQAELYAGHAGHDPPSRMVEKAVALSSSATQNPMLVDGSVSSSGTSGRRDKIRRDQHELEPRDSLRLFV